MEENKIVKLLGGGDKPCFSSTASVRHELHLKGMLTGPEDYIEWVRTIRGAGPDDIIEFHINTPGGDVYTAIELLGAFDCTEAHVHVILNGICASAGTILMAVGDSFEINPHTAFLFHNYSGGIRGKGNDMHKQMEFERPWSIELMSSVYDGMLTQEELDKLVNGEDFWLTAEQVGVRLGKLVDARQEAREAAAKEVEAAIKKASKKKKSAK